MQDANRSLRRSSASSSHETFLNLEYKEKTELKRVIDFLQEQYQGLASELASKELELKVVKSRRMPSESFELRNQEYETKSEINQLKFKHMTELQETMAEHQLEIDIIKNQFEEKLERQYENFKREFSRNKKESATKLEDEVLELSEKNVELNRTISHLEIRLKDQEKKALGPENEQELKHLKKLLAEKEIEIQRLQRQLKESEQYNEEIKFKLNEKNKEIDYFVNEMNREKSSSRHTMFEKPTTQPTKMQKLQKSRSTQINELSDQLVFIKQQNDRLRKLNDRYKNLVTDRQNEMEELGQHMRGLEKQINSHSITIEGLNQEIREYQTGKKIFQSEMSRLNDNIQKGLGDVSTKQTEIRDLNNTIDKLKMDCNILNGKISDQDSEKKRLEEMISRQNDRLGSLEQEIRNFNIQIHKKEEQIKELNGLIQYNKSECKGLQIAFQTKQSQYQIVCGENREYLLSNQGLKNELNDAKREGDELRHKLHKTEEDNNDLLQSLKQLKVQYQNVRIQNSTLKQFEDACSHLRNEIVQLEHQVKLAKQDNRREIEETYRYKLEYESALVELQEAEERLKQIEAERMDFSDRAQLLEQLKKYTEVVENTSKLNSQLSSEMRSLKEGNSRLAEEKLGLERKLQRVEEKSLKSRVVDTGKASSLGQLQSQVTRLQLLVNNLDNEKRFFETKAEDATREKEKLMGILQRQLSDINSTSREKEDQSRYEMETLYKTVNDAKQQIHQLKGELNTLSLENTKMKNSFKGEQELQVMEVEGLREQLKRKNHENETLSKRWNALKQEQMQRLSSDKHLNIMLQSELSATKTKLELTEVNLRDRQGDIERLNNKFQKLASEKEGMELELDRLKIEQWKHRTAIENLEGQKQSLTKELKSKEMLFQQQLNALKSDNQDLGASNEELTEYVKDLEKERNRLEIDNQMMAEGLTKVTKERNQLKELLSKVELDLASTRVENESLKRKKPEMQSLKTSYSDIGKIREQLEKEKKLRAELQEQISSLKKSASGLKQKQHKRREITDQHNALPKNGDLEAEIRRLNEQIRASTVEFNELLKYRSDLQMKLVQTGDELRKARQQLSYKQNSPPQPVIQERNNVDPKAIEYIRELQMRCKLVEDINSQLRKKEYEQQQKVTRILADNKTELTHYKLENNRLEKERTELEMRIKQVQNHLNQLQQERSSKMRSSTEEASQLKEELKNVYSQIHSLNTLLIQKQNQITNLTRNREMTPFGSLQHISSPKQKQKEKKTLKNTEECWRDMQERIKTGQKQYNKTRMHN